MQSESNIQIPTDTKLTEDQVENMSAFIIESFELAMEEAEANYLMRNLRDYFK